MTQIIMLGKIKIFANEVAGEMKKVHWPTKEQLKESTKVVIGTTLVISALVLVIDQIMTQTMSLLF